MRELVHGLTPYLRAPAWSRSLGRHSFSMSSADGTPQPLTAHEMRVERFPAGVFDQNTWLAWCPHSLDAVAIDPGAGAGDMLRKVNEDGLNLVAVLLTHAHADHVEGLAPVRDRHPEVPIHLHPADRPLYDWAVVQAAHLGVKLRPPPPPTHELAHGQSFRVGESSLEVRHAPGHSPGHVILVEEDARSFAIVADVVFSGSIGRTDLPVGDHAVLLRTIADEILTLPDATVLHTGHGLSTSVREERAHNPFLQGLCPSPGR